MEEGMAREKVGGKAVLCPCLAYFFLLFFLPVGHLFPACNMTPSARLGSASFGECALLWGL